MKIGVLLQAQLAAAGIRVNLKPLEAGAVTARQTSRDFDAVLGGFHLGASPDGTREAWTAVGLGKDGFNYGSYVNPLFDEQLSAALSADSAHARDLFSAAYATINEDVPAVWLYEPKTVIGVDRRFHTGWMRPDAWWSDLGNWYVPASERITRDRVLLRR
ncbi:MAG TPA: hypothetical protein VEV81_08215 [Pyrinomonadaceae bacterium]|nr:hypothetical protein [Pyrinomonadaceae bacterium]